VAQVGHNGHYLARGFRLGAVEPSEKTKGLPVYCFGFRICSAAARHLASRMSPHSMKDFTAVAGTRKARPTFRYGDSPRVVRRRTVVADAANTLATSLTVSRRSNCSTSLRESRMADFLLWERIEQIGPHCGYWFRDSRGRESEQTRAISRVAVSLIDAQDTLRAMLIELGGEVGARGDRVVDIEADGLSGHCARAFGWPLCPSPF
jgi:hypothetical protein